MVISYLIILFLYIILLYYLTLGKNSHIINVLKEENNELKEYYKNLIDNQDLNINELENQIIYVEGNGNIIGISDVLVNGVSVVSDNIAYVLVPTKTSDLINDSGYITNESDPTVPYYIKQITLADINSWNNKQDELVSGSNIKTINNESLLGSGNINIGGTDYTAGYGINIDSEDVISNSITSYNDLTDLPTIPTQTSELINDSNYVTSNELSEVAFSGSFTDLSNAPDIPTDTSDLINDSGFIDKDVNDLTYYTLTSNLSTVATSGDYDDLTNKPSIPTVNNGTLTIQQNGTNVNTFTANSSTNVTANITVPTNTSDLINDSGFITSSSLPDDSGWLDLTLENGVTSRDNTAKYKPQYRKIGNIVYLKGQVSIPAHSAYMVMATLPSGYRPYFEGKLPILVSNNWIDTDGKIYISADNTARNNQNIQTWWTID
mgnify:CR=1 FL=1